MIQKGFQLARRGVVGYEGKGYPPSQIDLANGVFSPPASGVDRAKRILVALDAQVRVRPSWMVG